MSALPPKADMDQHRRDVRFVPKADSRTTAMTGGLGQMLANFRRRAQLMAHIGEKLRLVLARLL